MLIAKCVLTTPGATRNTTFSRRSKNASSGSESISFRRRGGLEVEVELRQLLHSGEPAPAHRCGQAGSQGNPAGVLIRKK